ncbi:MAG TPA: hypothetical protein V6D04_04620 [Candidatus Obscuribacterales bacterium]
MSMDYGLSYAGFSKPDAYTPYAAGAKMYGFGRPNPTSGPVSPDAQEGYQQRDMMAQARKRAILARMSAGQRQRFMDPDYLRGLQ